MEKFLNKVIKFTQTRYMKVMMEGFMGVAAITIAGSLFNLLKSLPIDAYQTFLTNSGLGDLLSIPISITTDLMALYVVVSMAYRLALSFNKNGFSAGLISLGAFMILTPLTTSSSYVDSTGETIATTISDVIPLSSVGSQGIFLAIIVGLLATRLYIFFLDQGWKIKMPDSVPANVSSVFEDMLPGGLVFVIFLVVRYLFGLTSYGTVQSFIYTILQAPLMNVGGGLVGALIFAVMTKVFWLFGVHGGMVTRSAMGVVMTAASAANLAAFAAGEAAPYPEWTYVSVTCAGVGVLALNILMFTAKSQQYRALAKVAIPTSVFGITEPMMFGTPIVMNPVLAAPFILSPVVSVLLTSFVTRIGLVAMPTGASGNMFIPIPISMALLNAHWTGFVWGFVMIFANMVLYYPFFRIADSRAVAQEQAALTEAA